MKRKRRYKYNYKPITVIHKHYHYFSDDHFKHYEPYNVDLKYDSNNPTSSDDWRQTGSWDSSLGGGFSSD